MSATFTMRDAATLLLVRDTPVGLEVFMVERPGAADFGGMHVFPGGKVDADDSSAESCCVDLNDSLASERLGIARGGIAFWSAVIREAFEEAGVLLGYRGDASGRSFGPGHARPFRRPSRRGTQRRIVDRRTVPARRPAARYRSRALLQSLDHASRPAAPLRHALFFAHMPENQEPAHHEGELEDGLWVRPADALANQVAGKWTMIFPTLTTLRSLARYERRCGARSRRARVAASAGDH